MTVSFGANWPTIGLFVNFDGLVGGTWTDVSQWVRRVDVDRGPSRETGRFPAGSMRVQLDNRDGRFSPANLAGPYVAGGASQVQADVRVRLEATWAGTTHNVFCGYTEDWQDEFPAAGYDAVTTLTALDPLTLLGSWTGTPVTPVGAGERSGARVARILDALGFPALTRSIMVGDETLQATDLGGNGVSLLNLTTDSELGAYWYDPLRSINTNMGGLVWESRSALSTNARSTTSQATFSPASLAFRDPSTSSGRDRVVRAVAYSRVGGLTQEAVLFSLGGNPGTPRLARADLVNETDAGVYATAELTLMRGTPGDYRVTGVTIDPITVPATMWPAALGLRIRDRATVSMPVRVSGLTIAKNVFIDGISHSIEPQRWVTSFDFASATWVDALSPASVWDTGVWNTAKWFH